MRKSELIFHSSSKTVSDRWLSNTGTHNFAQEAESMDGELGIWNKGSTEFVCSSLNDKRYLL